jgi:hypothetical protein
MTTIEQKIAKILDRKMRQVAHKSPAAQASYRARQQTILRDQLAAQHEAEFVKAVGFHSDGSPTLGTLARTGTQ